MKILSAIVLLMWTVCYGRCLADQSGLLKSAAPVWHCDHACCPDEGDQAPPEPENELPCEVCDFIAHGGAPTGVQLELNAPVLLELFRPIIEFAAVIVRASEPEPGSIPVTDTGPRGRLRLCEWMASTATPVRGPNAGA